MVINANKVLILEQPYEIIYDYYAEIQGTWSRSVIY